MRTRFDEQLNTLGQELIRMGALCEEAISLAASALIQKDDALAAKIAPLAHEIDEKERKIEAMCLRLFLQQQPVARDLRTDRESGRGHRGNPSLPERPDAAGIDPDP